jgi:hypothetical protein
MERNLSIDYLKVLGLMGVILAHVGIGQFLFQMRNFDVTLLVICSGALSQQSLAIGSMKTVNYIRKRVARLVIPSWIFLILFFLMNYAISKATQKDFLYAPKDIIQEFLFRSKIIGLWIIRIFIFIACALPLIHAFRKKLSHNGLFFLFLMSILILLELIHVFLPSNTSMTYKIANVTVFQFVPYACICGLGLLLSSLDRRSTLMVAVFFFAIYLFLYLLYSGLGISISTQAFKYPPRMYYLSYGVFVTFLLYLFFETLKPKFNRLIVFMSSSLLWIYLWHWFFLGYAVRISQFVPLVPTGLLQSPLVQFLLILSLSVGLTLIQKVIIRNFISAYKPSVRTTAFLTVAFLQ